MTLAALIRKGGLRQLMCGSVAGVASAAVARSIATDIEDIREWWGERTGIMEHDGGLPIDKAESEAWLRTLARFELPAGYKLN